MAVLSAKQTPNELFLMAASDLTNAYPTLNFDWLLRQCDRVFIECPEVRNQVCAILIKPNSI